MIHFSYFSTKHSEFSLEFEFLQFSFFCCFLVRIFFGGLKHFEFSFKFDFLVLSVSAGLISLFFFWWIRFPNILLLCFGSRDILCELWYELVCLDMDDRGESFVAVRRITQGFDRDGNCHSSSGKYFLWTCAFNLTKFWFIKLCTYLFLCQD